MLKAAELWAIVRQKGKPTAVDSSLDGDMILSAQISVLQDKLDEVVFAATTNVKHLSLFIAAVEWTNL